MLPRFKGEILFLVFSCSAIFSCIFKTIDYSFFFTLDENVERSASNVLEKANLVMIKHAIEKECSLKM